MERHVATEIIALALECSGRLNQSAKMVQDTCPTQEFERYRNAVGNIMGHLYLDIMVPIFREYPDLEPEDFK